MKKIAVVTVNYNTEKDTHTLLSSLAKGDMQNVASLQIIVVDNGSENPFILEKNEHATVIRLEKNTGFTGGYNAGIKKALKDGADYLLLLNNDTLVAPDMITQLLQPFEHHKDLGVTVPKIYFAKGHEFYKDRYKKEELGKVLWYAGGDIDWNNITSVHRGVDEVDHGQFDREEEVSFATGCCLFIKSEVIKKVGMLDDHYFLYYEDADLNVRIQKAGYRILYVPKAKLWHVNASSSGSGSALHDYFLTRNQLLFGMKYAPLRSKLALLRQSFRLLSHGRPKQKQGVKDFYARKFGKGTFFE